MIVISLVVMNRRGVMVGGDMKETADIRRDQSFSEFIQNFRTREQLNDIDLTRFLLESIDEVFQTCFGREAASLLKRFLNVTSCKIVESVVFGQFSADLRKILGAGAEVIEHELIRSFISKYSSEK